MDLTARAGRRVAAVSWRRVAAIVAVTAALLAALVVVVRSDGLPAVDATAGRATKWFVHQATGRVVLADGYAGRGLIRLETGEAGRPLDVAEGAGAAFLLDASGAEARPIDSVQLRLGPGAAVAPLASPAAVSGVGPNGLVVVDTASSEGTVLAPSGEAIPFAVAPGDQTVVATDGAVWSIEGTTLRRSSTTRTTSTDIGTASVELTTVGASAFVLDREGRRARFHDGDWVSLPDDVPTSELVAQVRAPAAACAWIGADDRLWCVGRDGIDEAATVAGLDLDGGDVLAVAGDAAAVVQRVPPAVIRLDLRGEAVRDDVVASVPATADLRVTATADLIWVDDAAGDLVWAVNPWGLQAIVKDDALTPLLGETGEVIEAGSSTGTGEVPDRLGTQPTFERRPDDDGIDDPPVAVDDRVRSRTTPAVAVAVTANDYDPDGEAVAVVAVGAPTRGSVDVASASTVVYRPQPGFVGTDRFEYTIADGNGTEATAVVTVELVAADASNRAPVPRDDRADTAADRAVVIDVLANDLDPERDALRIASFTPADVGGEVTETQGPSGLPALRYEPPPGVSGTATFSYRPVDALDAVGDTAVVEVEIAQPTDPNRPPVTRPDAVRLRRNVPTEVLVLANDTDPDSDPLVLGVPTPLPDGLDVRIDGVQLRVTARAGAAPLVPFTYTVDDGNGHVVPGSVLVSVVDDVEPNRPPLANADVATAVVGEATAIRVLANDSDPDGDPLILLDVDVTQGGTAVVDGDTVRFVPAALVGDDASATVRFTYRVTDGNGNEAVGDVAVTVLAEPLAAPPYARDDAASTERDRQVTVDVLGNDGDPSGERPSLVGEPGCSDGTARVTADQRVQYTPSPGAVGVFRCTYEVTNRRGLRATASIIVTVREPAVDNQPPVVQNESISVETGSTTEVDVLANDRDPDGDRAGLRVLSSTTPSIGTARRDGGIITFVAGDVVGATVISYQVGDAGGGVSVGRLVIRVQEPVPQPPIATPDARTIVGPGVATTFDVLANDVDPDGDRAALTVVSVTVESGAGTATTNGRSATLQPDPDFVGDLVVSYAVRDADGLTAASTVTLTVQEPANRSPVAAADAAEVENGGTVTVPVLFNDSDPDADPLTVRIVSGPSPDLGAATVTTDGSIRFVADPDVDGTAVVTYAVSDGEFEVTATLTLTVLPCTASAPVAPNVFLTTPYATPIAVDLRDYARNGTVTDVGPPLSAPSGVVTPAEGENGNIVIDYSVVNACDLVATGTLTIDVNQDPVARPVQLQIGRRETRVLPVSDLATDAETLRIVSIEDRPRWVTATDDGATLTIAPDGVAATTATFAVIVTDPGGLQALVPVTIQVVDLPPVANPDTVDASDGPVTFRPLDNDVDPDGDRLAIQAIPQTATFEDGAIATITVLADGRVRIDPGGGRGTATFTYTVVDESGQVSAPAVVTIRVNRRPVARDVAVTLAAATETLLALDAADPDGDPLVASVSGVPGELTVLVEGLALRIAAPAAEVTRDLAFTYTVTDPRGASASATVFVTVVPPPTTTTTSTTTTTTTTTSTTTTTTVRPGRGP